MERDHVKYCTYLQILEEELIPAMGCTEPIALAYGAAKAREVLEELPDRVLVQVSGSIIKNVKSVIVPNTDHLKGIPAAVAAGIVAGQPERQLEVIATVSRQEIQKMKEFLDTTKIQMEHIDYGPVFDLIITVFKGSSYAKVRITDFHTNIILIEKDGQILLEKEAAAGSDKEVRADRSLLDMESIWDFAMTVDVEDVREVLERQIRCNTAIASEGLRGRYGACMGRTLLKVYGDDIRIRAKAKAAAGSDARMNGCEMPVVINSGSGNQGITASVPVIEYAEELNSGEEKLFRALVLSNLTAIHQKTWIGTLSAFCGVVSAGAAAGAGIAYLRGGGYREVIHTIVNSLAIVSGIFCDGAKASCAAKIAASVDAAILGYEMYCQGQEFEGGDGIVMKDVEATIRSIGYIGREGMRDTNEKIINMMMEE
ncbi:MAG: serine dehydratase subunit alpha family protein [Hungatella sp.]|nr:serine dehydratase subunit alpha family protein [Hungatella sp.]